MRISREKAQGAAIELPAAEMEAALLSRKKELAALIQTALKVGADYPAREAGRKAFAEMTKLDRDLLPGSALVIGASGPVIFGAPKRRRMRAAI